MGFAGLLPTMDRQLPVLYVPVRVIMSPFVSESVPLIPGEIKQSG